jgi:hypothetical protein
LLLFYYIRLTNYRKLITEAVNNGTWFNHWQPRTSSKPSSSTILSEGCNKDDSICVFEIDVQCGQELCVGQNPDSNAGPPARGQNAIEISNAGAAGSQPQRLDPAETDGSQPRRPRHVLQPGVAAEADVVLAGASHKGPSGGPLPGPAPPAAGPQNQAPHNSLTHTDCDIGLCTCSSAHPLDRVPLTRPALVSLPVKWQSGVTCSLPSKSCSDR